MRTAAYRVTSMLLPRVGTWRQKPHTAYLSAKITTKTQRERARTQVEVGQKPSGDRMKRGGNNVQRLMQGPQWEQWALGNTR